MRTLTELSTQLKRRAQDLGVSQQELAARTGVSRQTLSSIFGASDLRVSTLLALADRLGLELALVPKEAAQALEQGSTRPASVLTSVKAALARIPPSRPVVHQLPSGKAHILVTPAVHGLRRPTTGSTSHLGSRFVPPKKAEK